MAIAEIKSKNVPIKLWAPINEIESDALDQLKNVASLSQAFHHVAAMPDVHVGKGATVGSVVALQGAVIPSAVGVDICCGMDAVKTNLKDLRKNQLEKIHTDICERIPTGFNKHESVHKDVKGLHNLWRDFENLTPEVHRLKDNAMAQIGTLGGGNHFIELSKDQHHNIWIVLHSGSRNIGKEIADVHIKKAKDYCKAQGFILPHQDLSMFVYNTKEYDQYIHDVRWAGEYAQANRARMMELILRYLEHGFHPEIADLYISCHHNYIAEETHYNTKVLITRKGAINAEVGRYGIIPGAMGAKSFIVKGLGCQEAFNSAPHGAGRKMSRSKAKAKYNLKDAEETMNGIVCKLHKSMVDEIKYSYKNIDKVINNSKELVKLECELHQVLNIKG